MEEAKSPIRLNAGCGLTYRPDFINFDFRPADARVDLAADILALPFHAGLADQIVLTHVLEHVAKQDVLLALLEARGALRVGGTVALEVPDLDYCAKLWLNTPEPHRWGFPADAIFGDQTHPGQFHKTGFTRTRLLTLVERAGLLVEQAAGGTSHGVEVIRMLARRPPPFENRSDLGSAIDLVAERELGRGWWGLEKGESGPFRWTAGKATAFLRAPQPRASKLRLRGYVSVEHVAGGKVTIRLGCSGRVLVEKGISASGPVTLEAALPLTCVDEEFHAVRITAEPAFHAPADERQLGIIVYELGLSA